MLRLCTSSARCWLRRCDEGAGAAGVSDSWEITIDGGNSTKYSSREVTIDDMDELTKVVPLRLSHGEAAPPYASIPPGGGKRSTSPPLRPPVSAEHTAKRWKWEREEHRSCATSSAGTSTSARPPRLLSGGRPALRRQIGLGQFVRRSCVNSSSSNMGQFM